MIRSEQPEEAICQLTPSTEILPGWDQLIREELRCPRPPLLFLLFFVSDKIEKWVISLAIWMYFSVCVCVHVLCVCVCVCVPGHHAETTQCMGFCLLNSVAIAAQHEVDKLGLSR